MAIRSMTGYGRGEASSAGVTVEVELSSVNRKQFEVRINLPRSLIVLESRVNKLLRDAISRGIVTGTVKIGLSDKGKSSAISVDMEVASAYVRALRSAAGKLGLSDDLTACALTRLPDVLRYQDASADSDRVWQLLRRALKAALVGLLDMREAEGRALQRDLERRFARLRNSVARFRKLAPTVPTRYGEAMKERLKKAHLNINLSDESLMREIAVFADKSDVSEELIRLDSHLDQVAGLITRKAASGRSLDFLCQELLREINTIGSKANDLRLSRGIIEFKTELECIREQVQNVE